MDTTLADHMVSHTHSSPMYRLSNLMGRALDRNPMFKGNTRNRDSNRNSTIATECRSTALLALLDRAIPKPRST